MAELKHGQSSVTLTLLDSFHGGDAVVELKMHITINPVVTSDPAIMLGKPVIAGTRIPVELILEKLAAGESIDDLLLDYPQLTPEAVSVALRFAVQDCAPTLSIPGRPHRLDIPMTVIPIDADNRIQLPAKWSEDLKLQGVVALERTSEGILIRPCPRFTWDDIFATKLVIGSAPLDQNEDDLEVTGDDFLF